MIYKYMKPIKYIVIISFVLLSKVYGQEIDSSFTKINTGNWLDLSYQTFNKDGEEIFIRCLEDLPEFPGGYDSLASFLTDTLIYPATALKDSIGGLVKTWFIVESNGEITNVKTLEGVRYDLDSVCINVVKLMPKWITSESFKTKGIRTAFVLPIKFTISTE